MAEKTIFKRIIDKELPVQLVYEDELCLAFYDVRPVAPVHILVIPKQEIPGVSSLAPADAALVVKWRILFCGRVFPHGKKY